MSETDTANLIFDFLTKGKRVGWICDATGVNRRDVMTVARNRGLVVNEATDVAVPRLQSAPPPAPTPLPARRPPSATDEDLEHRLTEAEAHPAKAVRVQAKRIRDAFDRLDDLIIADEDRHAATREAAKAKAAAKAEIDRLTAELKAAKARLRGTPKPVMGGGTPVQRDQREQPAIPYAEIRAWAKTNGVDVPRYGRVPNAVIDKWKAATQAAAS